MSVPAPSLHKQASLTKQAFSLLAARVLGFLLAVALPIVLVRIFDRTGIGLYRQAFLVIATAVNVLPFGFHLSSFYYLPRETERRGAIICNIVMVLSVAGLSSLLVLAIWPQSLDLLIGHSALHGRAALIGGIVFAWLFSSFLETVATANRDIARSTIFIISAQLTKTTLILAAALAFRTIDAVLYAALAQGLIQSALLVWYLRKEFPRFWSSFDYATLREQASYVFPFGVAGLVYMAQCDFHTYLVAHRFSPADYAIYSVGIAQLPLVTLLRDAVNNVLLSRVSELQQKGQDREIGILMLRTVRKLSAVYLPICAGAIVLGREFIVTLYTPQYLGSYPILAVNTLLLLMIAFTSDPVLRAYTNYRFVMLRIRCFMLAVLVALAIPGVHFFGMLGAIGAFVLSVTIERIILFALTMKITGIRLSDWIYLKDVLKFASAAVLMTLAGLLTRWALAGAPAQFILVAGALIMAVVYVSVVVTAGALEFDEKRAINSYLSRSLRFVLPA